jgi:Bacterial mobilisation protein (MobC)
VLVRLTSEERAELTEQAAARGISVPRYLVECAAAVQVGGGLSTATDQREEMASLLGVRRLLANVANNVNQVAKAANASGLPMVQGEALAAFRAAKRASDRIYDLVDGMLVRQR